MFKIFKRYSTYTLVVALFISAISAYYSIVGLTAIFAAAVVPIIIMGAALELGKLVAAVWLKLNWGRAPLTYKMYLVPAVAFLMALTSMGIFGFLSKAHSDQSLVSGDSMAKIAIYDEKIKISKDNIDMNRKALKQMDEGVDQLMGRSTDENGAAKAVAIRKSQQKERSRMLSEIEAEQKKITALNEERAPLAAENRKIEAEVGPIRYIAALIYDDTTDSNVLEKAVRFVIIMIVAVFDPLALVLILAAQQSMRWEREEEEAHEAELEQDVEEFFDRAKQHARQLDEELAVIAEANAKLAEIEHEPADVIIPEPERDLAAEANALLAEIEPEVPEVILPVSEVEDTRSLAEQHPYLERPFVHFENTQPMVATKPENEPLIKPLEGEAAFKLMQDIGIFTPDGKLAYEYGGEEPEVTEARGEVIDEPKILTLGVDSVERPGDYVTPPTVDSTVTIDSEPDIQTANVTVERVMYSPNTQGYVNIEGKQTSIESLKTSHPHLIMPADGKVENKFNFGDKFPPEALIGDLYMRTDARPHRLFKFNGAEWIHVNKEMNTSYLQSSGYVKFLISALDSNTYLPEMLTDDESDEIRAQLDE
jgi:hypothetical protein